MIAGRTAWLLVATLAVSSACANREAASIAKELELGPHRIQVSAPAGWELLDQGAQKRFRKGESEIVLQNLGKVDWELGALKKLSDDQRREVKSRRPFMIDVHEAVEIETWNRLDHTWPQRLLLVRADDDVLALHTPRLADDQTVKAFESIRDSLHLRLR